MCNRNRRDEIVQTIRSYFPVDFIAKHILIGSDGKSREGYTTEFKRVVGQLLSKKTPPFKPAEIAALLGVNTRCVMLWEAKFRRGHFDKAHPRDKVYANGGQLTIVTLQEYAEIQKRELLQFSKTNNLTNEQYEHLSKTMLDNMEKHYTTFREDDGDWDNLIEYFELLFMEYVTNPDSTYQQIKTMEEVVDAQPMETVIDTTQTRLDSIKNHWDAISALTTNAKTMHTFRYYVLSHKPRTPEDILYSIDALPCWANKTDKNRVYARLLDYCVGYVGPHVDKKAVPLTIRNKVSKQLILLPDNKWIVIPGVLLRYIDECRSNGTWDWETLLLADSPIPSTVVPMRDANGIPYKDEGIDDDGLLFGRRMSDTLRWSYYVDMVKTVAPEVAIPAQQEAEIPPVVIPEPTPVPEPVVTPVKVIAPVAVVEPVKEVVVPAAVTVLVEELAKVEEVVATPEVPTPSMLGVEANEDHFTILNESYLVDVEYDESYDGSKWSVPVDFTKIKNAADVEEHIHGILRNLLRIAVPKKRIPTHDVAMIRTEGNGTIHIIGHTPIQTFTPMKQSMIGGQTIDVRPYHPLIGCCDNCMTTVVNQSTHGNMLTSVYVTHDTCINKKHIRTIRLTVVNGKPMHFEFISKR